MHGRRDNRAPASVVSAMTTSAADATTCVDAVAAAVTVARRLDCWEGRGLPVPPPRLDLGGERELQVRGGGGPAAAACPPRRRHGGGEAADGGEAPVGRGGGGRGRPPSRRSRQSRPASK